MLKQILISASLTLVATNAISQTVVEQVALQGLPVHCSEGPPIGHVRQIRIATDGQVGSVRVELIGDAPDAEAKTVEVPATKFTREGDHIVLSMTADEVGQLPAVP
jgi:hypothetical protein